MSEKAVRCFTTSAGETQKLAEMLARFLRHGDLVLLCGDLGAGKTTFTKAAARALGVTEPVTSPTFALAHHYSAGGDGGKGDGEKGYRAERGRANSGKAKSGRRGAASQEHFEIRHLDLYRLENPAEMTDYIAEELESALVLAEWGEPLAEIFAGCYLRLSFSFGGGGDGDIGTGEGSKDGDSDHADYRDIEISGVGQRWEAVWQELEAALLPWQSK